MKRALRFVIIVSILAISCFSLNSCGFDEEDAKKIRPELVGTWHRTMENAPVYTEWVYVFNLDGTFSARDVMYYLRSDGSKSYYTSQCSSATGTYKITENNIVLNGTETHDDGNVRKIENHKITYTYNSDSGRITMLGNGFIKIFGNAN